MSTVLVTGASGFIGKHLVPRLRSAGNVVHDVGRAAGDVAEEATWAAYPPVDVVVHLAGKAFVPESWSKPELFFKCNLMGAVAALHYCRQHKARLVYLSSYLYGNPASLPIAESAPRSATNPYALSKCMAEDALRFYAENFAIPVTVLRPFNVYGPGQSDKFLVPLILNQMRAGGPIRVQDLEPRRDYVHVFDLVDAIVRATGDFSGFNIYNIGSGESHSVAQIIEIAQRVWNTRLPVISQNQRRPGEIMDTIADVSAARARLGWRPRITLEEGMQLIHEAERRPVAGVI